MSKKRKKYTPEQKVQILKKHLVDRVPLSDLCDQYGLHPTVFYRWQKAFFENGAQAFNQRKDADKVRLEKKIGSLEAKLSKKHEVLSELMEEHVALKKNLGEP
jgi:transposase-like protein